MELENTIANPEEEKKLYRKARRRANMKIHAAIYFLVLLILWLLWYFIFRGSDLEVSVRNFCLGLTLIWGIIVYVHYLIIFKWGKSYVEKEAKRIRKKQEKLEQEKDIQ